MSRSAPRRVFTHRRPEETAPALVLMLGRRARRG